MLTDIKIVNTDGKCFYSETLDYSENESFKKAVETKKTAQGEPYAAKDLKHVLMDVAIPCSTVTIQRSEAYLWRVLI